ncbi:MAG: hypothetical protein GX937_06955 [Lentisphaerae bacterium]|jgi:hypothetical protein|nr:hypothetical protein [Lentisphaerota bacterium]
MPNLNYGVGQDVGQDVGQGASQDVGQGVGQGDGQDVGQRYQISTLNMIWIISWQTTL